MRSVGVVKAMLFFCRNSRVKVPQKPIILRIWKQMSGYKLESVGARTEESFSCARGKEGVIPNKYHRLSLSFQINSVRPGLVLNRNGNKFMD